LVCADTSFVIALERREKAALQKMQELDDKSEIVYTTYVTVAELYHGVYCSKDRVKASKDAKNLLGLFAILNLDYESGRIWGELAHSMKSDTIGDRDLFIASIALENKQVLITKSRKHFDRIPSLQVEGW
jgi:tRNA(fMet)-specific endonuclease VapC